MTSFPSPPPLKESESATHLQFIDALRGIAVMLVIASHAFPLVRELPWTVKRFTNLGFYGVQLFFVVSGFTLARSWRQRETRALPSWRDFAIRRVFRIAPAYFLAALLYLPLEPGESPSALRVATFVSFTNGWSPAQMPTLAGVWIGVPGGWSIEAEFVFYAIFPLLMARLRGPWRTLAALLCSIPLAWAAHAAGWTIYGPHYDHTATDQFLYYWFPTQLPVFLCGLMLYEAVMNLAPGGKWTKLVNTLRRRASWLVAAGVIAFAALALVPVPRVPVLEWGLISAPLVAAGGFVAIALGLARKTNPLFINPFFVRLGQVSFSAYLLHFVFLNLAHKFWERDLAAPTGLWAVLVSGAAFLGVLGVTFAASLVTYRVIEKPAMDLGSSIIRRLARNHK